MAQIEKPDTPVTPEPEIQLAPEIKSGDCVLAPNKYAEEFVKNVTYPDRDYTYSVVLDYHGGYNGQLAEGESVNGDKSSEYTIRWEANEAEGKLQLVLSEQETGWSMTKEITAGSYAQLLAREGKFAIIKLPSGETRMVLVTCRATVGVVSNVDHNLESSGKAGRKRWLGRRPHNRGVVMNPVDHPMGGGEGRSSGGHPRSRKGLLAKGYKTRNPKKTTSKFIISKKTK